MSRTVEYSPGSGSGVAGDPAPPGPIRLTGLTGSDVGELLQDMGCPAYRGRQIFSWLHSRLASSFGGMSDLPLALRKRLAEIATITRLAVREVSLSPDGTSKLVLGLEDGLVVEAVLIRGDRRLTACLSTQVGCPLGCTFCMTGRVGFRRDLGADEIVAQLEAIQGAGAGRIANVVFMGMGEPLLNLRAVRRAIEVITDGAGAGIGTRHVTVSTVGIPSGIRELEALPGQTGLAVSLHSAVQRTRERIVPAAARWRLPELREAIAHYSHAVNRPVTLEYCLIEGVNDSPAEAAALREYAGGLDCKVNLMAWNEVPGLPLKRPSESALLAFGRSISFGGGPTVLIRRSRGAGTAGACGQLGASLLADGPGCRPSQGTKERRPPTVRPERSPSPARSRPRGSHSGEKKKSK